MARPTAIVVWFDDNTRYHIDPSVFKSLFINEAAAARCGHPGPHELPTTGGPVQGPFADTDGPPSTGTGSRTATADACVYVNGVIVCPD